VIIKMKMLKTWKEVTRSKSNPKSGKIIATSKIELLRSQLKITSSVWA